MDIFYLTVDRYHQYKPNVLPGIENPGGGISDKTLAVLKARTTERSDGKYDLRRLFSTQVQPNLGSTIIFRQSLFFHVETTELCDRIWCKVKQYLVEKLNQQSISCQCCIVQRCWYEMLK